MRRVPSFVLIGAGFFIGSLAVVLLSLLQRAGVEDCESQIQKAIYASEDAKLQAWKEAIEERRVRESYARGYTDRGRENDRLREEVNRLRVELHFFKNTKSILKPRGNEDEHD